MRAEAKRLVENRAQKQVCLRGRRGSAFQGAKLRACGLPVKQRCHTTVRVHHPVSEVAETLGEGEQLSSQRTSMRCLV